MVHKMAPQIANIISGRPARRKKKLIKRKNESAREREKNVT